MGIQGCANPLVVMMAELLSKVWHWFAELPGALLGFAGSWIERVSPRELTVTRIGVIEVRIRGYWKTHGRLPAHLSELPELPGRDNATIDGWGRAIEYDAIGTIVTLLSSGANRKNISSDESGGVRVSFDVKDKKVFEAEVFQRGMCNDTNR